MIKEIHLKSFGQFEDLKLQFTSGINLIYAENEGGKTTLFSALEAGLLGFIPAGQSYPYFPWDGEELSLELGLEDGIKVERKMKSSITGYLYEDDQLTSIANQPVLGLSREYLRNFHLLQAEDLLELEQRSMDDVIEKHLESIYSSGGASPKKMLKILEEKRNQIYKKRGSNYLLYGVEEGLSNYQKDLRAYEEKVEALQEKKEELLHLEKLHQELGAFSSDYLYPDYLSKLSFSQLEKAKELERKEKNLKERKEELDQHLLEGKRTLSEDSREKSLKAYALQKDKSELLGAMSEQKNALQAIEEEIFISLGFRSVSLEHLGNLKLYSYYGALVTMLLSFLLGGIGWLLQKPEFFAPLLPLLLLFYFFFQSWKKQLYEAKIPGFFHSPKSLEKALMLNEERLKMEEEILDLQEDEKELLKKEKELLSELGLIEASGVEEIIEEEKRVSVQFREILEEKEDIAKLLQDIILQWELIGPGIQAYRNVGLSQLEEELKRKEQPSEAQSKHEKSTEKMARVKYEIETLEKELLLVPQGEEELLEEKESLLEAYNRSLFLSSLLEKSYQQYRDELLPKLLERTSSFLRAFTAGLYQKVMSSKDGELFLVREDGVFPLQESMSKGLRSQFYLALRLALIELVDGKMPLFFDEGFSNWDEKRLIPTLEKLQELPRQQFIFTCKERDLRLFEEIFSIKAIHL